MRGVGADPIWPELEWLQDLGCPEPPKKVAAPQHYTKKKRKKLFGSGAITPEPKLTLMVMAPAHRK